MFDEVNNQAASQGNGQPEVPATPVTPVAPATNNSVQPSASESTVQDIFASVESSNPTSPINSQPFGQISNPISQSAQSSIAPTSGNKSNIAKIVLISLAGLVVVAGGALVYIQYFSTPKAEVVTPEPIINQIENVAETSSEANMIEATSTDMEATSTETTLTETSSTDASIMTTSSTSEPSILVTTDGGSAVVSEPALTETPTNLDSDQDGLTDAEELNTYQTNPLKADSDGDGYTDGDEVKAGYNPLGDGKLAR
ncbi:MAG TPA: thrombospondin type 3 repeat-containing protein [bacterium]|nr:thrombospondin type 3 repeat-containing protein [bacterium]